MKLTKLAADRARYPHGGESKHRHVLWDDQCPGFGLRVYTSGRRAGETANFPFFPPL